MNQKRFLTADEVFQLFGVDAEALDVLVNTGEVKALADLGTFKYRAEDFANLVKQGKLSPRTSGEMFQVDSKGEVPFLKLKGDDNALKFDEDVSFLEIDEEALAEHAQDSQPAPSTPVVPENWFEDDEPIELDGSSDEIQVVEPKSNSGDEETDFDFNSLGKSPSLQDSDSNVRLVEDDDGIDFEEPDIAPTGSDSDVRLEGPVSSTGSRPVSFKKKPDSDSDVRLSKTAKNEGKKSDSDVTIAPTAKASPLAQQDASTASVPVAQPIAKKPESDSDVQLASPTTGSVDAPDVHAFPIGAVSSSDSDSDVVLVATPVEGGQSPFSKDKKPDSDSDVQLVQTASPVMEDSNAVTIPISKTGKVDSDSDVLLVNAPADAEPTAKTSKKPDSDVSLAKTDHEFSIAEAKRFSSSALDDIADEFNALADSNVRIEPVEGFAPGHTPAPVMHDIHDSHKTSIAGNDSGIRLESTDFEMFAKDDGITNVQNAAAEDHGIAVDLQKNSEETSASTRQDSDIALGPVASNTEFALRPATTDGENGEPDSGITLDNSDPDSGIALLAPKTDSEITIVNAEPDSGITLDTSDADSGIALLPPKTDSEIVIENADSDSGITLDTSDSDSGFALQAAKTDSDIPIHPDDTDSGISLEAENADSGITLLSENTDSDIPLGLFDEDSGIRLGTAGPDSGISAELDSTGSGIMLAPDDSGIQLSATDSGITFEDEVEGPNATLAEMDAVDFDSNEVATDMTQTLDLSEDRASDSGFDVSLAESDHDIEDHTMEMAIEDVEEESAETAPTIVNKGRTKSLSLSEAFKLDEPMEVEDLDISEDLDSVPESEYSGEFAEADEDVLEASDADFSAGEISAAEEAEESDSEEFVPAAKVRALPKEPAWGLMAVIPIGLASMVMAATATVLWGGVATMWTGSEAPGPAGMLISALAGMLPG